MIDITTGTLKITNTTLNDFTKGFIFASQLSELTLSNVTVNNGTSVDNGTAINCIACANVSITQSNFTNLSNLGNSGGALYFNIPGRDDKNILQITNNQF